MTPCSKWVGMLPRTDVSAQIMPSYALAVATHCSADKSMRVGDFMSFACIPN